MDESYEKVPGLCRKIIENDFRPCGLEDEIKDSIFKLTFRWEKLKEQANLEGREIGGLQIIFTGILKSAMQAEGLARRYDKDVCYYLRMSVQNKWLDNYREAFWK